jgi:DNA-binding NarL/FixJ family response regulator
VGLRALLEADTQIVVVAEGRSLDELLTSIHSADVLVLTSENLARLDFEQFSLEDWPEVSVLLLGDASMSVRSLPQLSGRAWGVLPREASQEELLAAVHALFEGLIVAEPSMLVSLMEPSIQVSERVLDEPVEMLTERELEVLQLLALGLANKQIAAQLGISAHTVKFHISSIYGKLGATNRTEAVRIGLQMGLILL